MLGIRLDESTEKRLENLSRKTGRSKSYYAKKALVDFLDEREDYLLALSRLEGNEPTIGHNDFWNRVESELDSKV